MEISKFRNKILIQKAGVKVDKYGNHLNVWEDYFYCFAYANNLSGAEFFEAAEVHLEKDMYFIVRDCSELKELDEENYRVYFRGQAYNIVLVDRIEYKGKVIKLRVRKLS